jgi:stage II sporulation protein D
MVSLVARHPPMTALLAALVLLAAWASPATASGLIRVAVVESAPGVELTGARITVTPLGGCPGCRPFSLDVVRAGLRSGAVEIAGRRAAGFRLTSTAPMRLNGREYTGGLEVIVGSGALAVVNELPMEDYVVGVVRAEVGDRWPPEALRAQAVAARTYAAYHRLMNVTRPYHVVATTAHQVFGGHAPAASPAWDAVRETAGQVLLWEGGLFPAFYHAESGGYTEDPRTVFTTPDLPALRAVVCPFSVGSPRYHWALDLPLADVAAALERHGMTVGAVRAIEVTERTPSLRATVVTVHGTRGSLPLRGNEFRRVIGFDVLRSTLFAVAIDDGLARFVGRGWGHGVGMCQWGARGMAEQGFEARQILEFYYPGATFAVLAR